MILAAPFAHGGAEALFEEGFKIRLIGISARFGDRFYLTLGCRKEFFHGIKLAARDGFVDCFAIKLLEA
jgi:hypothetical protein